MICKCGRLAVDRFQGEPICRECLCPDDDLQGVEIPVRAADEHSVLAGSLEYRLESVP
jgi:hypothetical protein